MNPAKKPEETVRISRWFNDSSEIFVQSGSGRIWLTRAQAQDLLAKLPGWIAKMKEGK